MGYPTKKLGDLVKITKGKKVNYSPEKGKYNYIDIGILRTGIIEQFTNDLGVLCHTNDIMIAWDGSKSGTVGFGLEGIIGSTLAKLEIKQDGINSVFLGKFLQSNFDYFNKNTSGAAIPHIRKDILIGLNVPIPPLPTQKLIVQKLDSSFEKIDKSIELTKNNLENIEELNKSVLEEVFSEGEYKIMKMNDICEKITDGTHQTPTYFENGVKFLSSKNVTSGFIDWKNIKYIDEKQHIEMSKRVTPKKGDILLAKNGTTGVGAIVDKDEIFDIYVSLALLRPKDFILSKYLLYFINSPIAKKQFNSRLKGVGVPNLHLKEIKEVEIPIFNFEKQKEIVAQLDQVFEKNKALKESYERKLKDLEEMKKSLLKEAFEGRLVKE